MTENGVEAAVEEERLKAILESLLFAAGEPVALAQLANAIDNVPRESIRKALAEMASEYGSGGRGVILEEIAGGYQLRTPREHALYVRRLLAAKPPRLSRPLLETLAIIAYRQPVTRPEIEQLRGVDTGGVLGTLLERGLTKIAGRKEAPGRPMMYATTSEFLELFGFKDLESLPDLAEFRAIEAEREEEPPTPTAESGEAVEEMAQGQGEPLTAGAEPAGEDAAAHESAAVQSDVAAPSAEARAEPEPLTALEKPAGGSESD
jgi:segregation and condensation protein B